MECSSEEQEMEVEALRSIYGEQFTIMAAREDKQPVSQPVLYEMKLQQSETKIVFTIPGKSMFHDPLNGPVLSPIFIVYPG